MTQDNLTNKQNDYAIFLPAISGAYSVFIGKQRYGPYVPQTRFPVGMTEMEELNWFNSTKAFFPYKWSLYSAGHATLDLNKPDAKEDMVRHREPGAFIVGDSGGFQIGKGLWEGEWRDPTSPEVLQKLSDLALLPKEKRLNSKGKEIEVDLLKEYQGKLDAAQKKRDGVLKWLDGIADYGMILDVPAWVCKVPENAAKVGITTYTDAVNATKYNNEYFMQHRKGAKEGGAKFLNVMQGSNHTEADDWYETMKEYCDPVKYPTNHFDGWAMGGQNTGDVHLMLRRLIAMRYDGLLQEGKHDWMHFLGTSKLEMALVLTDLQRAVRKYVNPAFTVSFDCASPFLATANGQAYYTNSFVHDSKWSYRMAPVADNKKYATDTRPWGTGVVADGIVPKWDDSPLSAMWEMKDICYYKPGDLNKIGKEGRTSWDSFSYTMLMGHNVWTHITAVQEANRRYDAGDLPNMLWYSNGDHTKLRDIVDRVFAAPTRKESEDIIDSYSSYWMDIIGSHGFKGKKTVNANTQFNALFEVVGEDYSDEDTEFDETALDELENENE